MEIKKRTPIIITIVLTVLCCLLITNSVKNYHERSNLKKAKKAMQYSLDSLQVIFDLKERSHFKELKIRRESELRDSLLISRLKKHVINDSLLLVKQAKEVKKYINLTNAQAIYKLDSAYKANH